MLNFYLIIRYFEVLKFLKEKCKKQLNLKAKQPGANPFRLKLNSRDKQKDTTKLKNRHSCFRFEVSCVVLIEFEMLIKIESPFLNELCIEKALCAHKHKKNMNIFKT